MMEADSIYLEQRFHILREIIAMYQARLTYMEKEVVELFASGQLAAIYEINQEKQRIESLIRRLDEFVAHWEAHAELSIDH